MRGMLLQADHSQLLNSMQRIAKTCTELHTSIWASLSARWPNRLPPVLQRIRTSLETTCGFLVSTIKGDRARSSIFYPCQTLWYMYSASVDMIEAGLVHRTRVVISCLHDHLYIEASARVCAVASLLNNKGVEETLCSIQTRCASPFDSIMAC